MRSFRDAPLVDPALRVYGSSDGSGVLVAAVVAAAAAAAAAAGDMGQLVVQLLVVAQCFEEASANASAGVDHHRGVAAVEERVPPEQVPKQYLFGCIGAVEVDGVAAAAAALGARVAQE